MKFDIKTILFGLAALSFVAACNKEMDSPVSENNDTVTVTVNAGVGGTDTKVALAQGEGKISVSWEDGDTFSATVGAPNPSQVYTFSMVGQPSDDGKTATFKCENMPAKDASNAGRHVLAYLPTISATSMNPQAWALDVSKQSGDDYDEALTYMYCDNNLKWSEIVDAGKAIKINFVPLVSVLKATLNFGSNLGTVENVTFKAHSGLYTSAQFNANYYQAKKWVSGETGSIKLSKSFTTDEDGNVVVYLYMIPCNPGLQPYEPEENENGKTDHIVNESAACPVEDLTVTAIIDGVEYEGVVNSGTRNIVPGKQYTKSVTMTAHVDEPVDALENFTVLATTDGYSYDGLDLTFGKIVDNTPADIKTVTVAEGKAVLGNEALEGLAAGTQIYVTIPKVAKFFHTLTADELAANALTLPDKNEGSTVFEDELIGGKTYKNDWIVALYMGIDSSINEGKPLYWATGNLIAVKTGEEGEASDPVFYIATVNDTQNEDRNNVNYFCQAKEKGGWTYVIDGDGFVGSAKGYAWDIFCFGDGVGNRTQVSKTPNPVIAQEDYDVCRHNLGKPWRIASLTGDKTGELGLLFSMTRTQDNKYNGYRYDFTTDNGIVNTLIMPKAGSRSASQNSPGQYVRYMSGTVYNNSARYYDGTKWSNAGSPNVACAVRPVTE